MYGKRKWKGRKGGRKDPAFRVKRARKGRRGFKKSYRKKRSRPHYGLPKTIVCKHRYVTHLPTDPAVGSWTSWCFRANSIFDPEKSTTGHQPAGTGEMWHNYRTATVLGSKIKMTAIYTSNSGEVFETIPAYFAIRKSDDDDQRVYYSSNHFLESPHDTKVMKVGQYQEKASNSIGDDSVTCTWSGKKAWGRGWDKGNTDFQTLDNTDDPVKEWFYFAEIHNIAGNNPGVMTFRFDIDYIVLWSERKVIAPSGTTGVNDIGAAETRTDELV